MIETKKLKNIITFKNSFWFRKYTSIKSAMWLLYITTHNEGYQHVSTLTNDDRPIDLSGYKAQDFRKFQITKCLHKQ